MTLRLYTGSIYDPDTGLYKIGARWYDPVIGLWLTPDALVPNVNNPLAWNGYAFNYNNPVNFVDPSGHFAVPAIALVAAIGFLGGEIYATTQGYNALDLEFWQYSLEGAFTTTFLYFAVADTALIAGYGLQGMGMWTGSARLFGWGMGTAGWGGAMYAWAFQSLQFRRNTCWKAEWVGGGGGLGWDDEPRARSWEKWFPREKTLTNAPGRPGWRERWSDFLKKRIVEQTYTLEVSWEESMEIAQQKWRVFYHRHGAGWMPRPRYASWPGFQRFGDFTFTNQVDNFVEDQWRRFIYYGEGVIP